MKRFIPYLVILLSVIIFFPTIFFNNHTFISSGLISSDLYLFNYPLKSLMHKSLLRGLGIPFWSDLIGNGYPIFAEGQMGEMYPFHLLFFILPFKTIQLFNLNLMLHYVLSGVFTYLYIKISIKTSQKAAVLGAFIFTFSGYMLTHLHQVNIILELTYFPLNLLLAETILRVNTDTTRLKKITLGLVLSLTLYMQMTAGHIEMVYYNILFTGIYAAIRFFFDHSVRGKILQKVVLSVTGVALAALVTLPQLYSTYELVKYSQRETGISYETTTGTLWPLNTLILFINPKAFDVYRAEPGYSPNKPETVNIGALYPYVGILPLVLSLGTLTLLIRKKSAGLQSGQTSQKLWIITFYTLLIFTYLYAVGRSTQLFSVVWEIIPGMKFFRFPVKAIYIIEFCIAVLASIGVHNLEEYLSTKTKTKETKNTQKQEILQKNKSNEKLLENQNFVKNAGNNKLASAIIVVLIALCFIDLKIFNAPTQPTIPADDWLKAPEFAQYINTQNPDCHCDEQANKYPLSAADQMQAPKFQNWRTYSHGSNNIDYTRIFDFPLQKSLQNILHTDYNMIHDISLNREWAVLFLQRQTILNKFNTKVNFETGELALPPEMKKSLDLQSVRYLVSDLPIVNPDLQLIRTHQFPSKVNHVLFIADSTEAKYIPTDKAYLYENKTYYPRVTLTPQFQAIYMKAEDKTASNIFKAVLSSEFNPTQQTLIEGDRQASSISNNEKLTAKYAVLSYEPEDIVLETETNQPAFLTLSDTYYPGWKVTVDNQPVELLHANYAFKAISVPAGKHQVHLRFEPTGWTPAMIAVLFGWSIFGTASLYAIIAFTKQRKSKQSGS